MLEKHDYTGQHGADVKIMPSDNRGAGKAEEETYTDKVYNTMIENLKKDRRDNLVALFESFSENQKEKLSFILNSDDADWGMLANLAKKHANAVEVIITQWKSEMDIAADEEAKKNAAKYLIQSLADL